MKKFVFLSMTALVLWSAAARPGHAATWIKAKTDVEQAYDDNVFLTNTDKKGDWVTSVATGLVLEPKLKKHELRLKYVVDQQYFAEFSDQNTVNHLLDAAGTLQFNKWRVEFRDRLRHREDRSGSEDTTRIKRTSNDADVKMIYPFDRMDVGVIYAHRLENFRSDESIGSFRGQALTYQDLDSQENSLELETAVHFWPKTSALFSGRYGILEYDTGRKSDSKYFDVLTGLRGQLTARSTVKGKIGFRAQEYETFSDDFNSLIFQARLTERFTERDRLDLNIERTTSGSTYQENAYFATTLVSAEFSHGFTDRFTGTLTGTYRLNDYPEETTEGSQTAKREDDLLGAGVVLLYKLPKWAELEMGYSYLRRSSNFEQFDYDNNVVHLKVAIEI